MRRANCCVVVRSMLRVVVDDGEATTTFELPDYLLQGITSLSYNHLVRVSFGLLLLILYFVEWFFPLILELLCECYIVL